MTPLRALAAHVERCLGAGEDRPDVDALAAALAGALAATPGLLSLAQSARFADEIYVRIPLLLDERYEVRLLCWRPGQSSALHGHGASACAFRVLTGVATELRLDGSIVRLAAGQIAAPAPGIHQVCNLGDEPLVTLHVYAPPLPVDQPSALDGRRVAVLGGGFSGAVLAIHLLLSGDPSLRITLVEPGPAIGEIDWRDEHVLDVPAAELTFDPERPGDFLAWARAGGARILPEARLPRRMYGAYVRDRLARTIETSKARLRLARSPAEAVWRERGRWIVRLIGSQHPVLADEIAYAGMPFGTALERIDPPEQAVPALARRAAALARTLARPARIPGRKP
jgi:mannose-6-phosphate isomerase-like protein (cupin superfamily)